MTDIAAAMEGGSAAAYKRIQRFLKKADPRAALWRLFQEAAEFVIGDPTEIERPNACKTEYVGKLKYGKTRGLLYGGPIFEYERVEDQERISPSLKKGKKWKRYSGLFILLKQKCSLSDTQKTAILQDALAAFRNLVYPPAPTFV